MDKNTFGDMQSSINLMTILDRAESPIYSRGVARVLSKYIKQIKSLMDIKDKETRETALIIWKHNYIDRLNKLNLPILIESHATCVIAGYCRKLLRETKNED